MMHLVAIADKRTRQSLSALATCVLLSLYILASFRIDSLHRVFHSHTDAVVHTADQESNSCHRSIYHNDTQNGCDHNAHVVVSKKCDLCDVIRNAHQENLLVEVPLESQASGSFIVHYSSVEISRNATHLPSRAPPVF